MRSLFVGLLGILALANLDGQERPFEMESAYREGAALRFVPSQRIDWAGRAVEEIRNLPIPTQDAAIVARFARLVDMFGGVEVRSPSPTPAELADRVYYFAGADGISSMRIDSTVVVTRLELDGRATSLRGRRSWGEMYGGSAEAGSAGGGFVLHSAGPLSFQTESSGMTADDLLLGSRTVQRTSDGGYWQRGTAFWEIVAQYRFSTDSVEGEWVFVQWAADRDMVEAGCQFRYQLFRVETAGAPTQVAWTAYGCDV